MACILTLIVAVLDLAFRVYKHFKESDNRPPSQE